MKDYSKLTDRIYTQLSPELSQEFHNMLQDMAKEISKLYEIENAKPSEALEEIGNIDLGDNPYKTFESNKLKNIYNKEFTTIKQALIELEKLREIDRFNSIGKSSKYSQNMEVKNE